MQDRAARRHWGYAIVLALVLGLAPTAQAAGDEGCGASGDSAQAQRLAAAPVTGPVAPAPAPAPWPTTPSAAGAGPSSALAPQTPLVRVLAARRTGGRVLRLRLRLCRDAIVSVGLRRLPTGTLVMRRFDAKAGLVTLVVGRGLRPGRYGIRVIAHDRAGERASVRAAPVQVRR
jgi:hypothetical protein